jgi:hypothetical protein
MFGRVMQANGLSLLFLLLLLLIYMVVFRWVGRAGRGRGEGAVCWLAQAPGLQPGLVVAIAPQPVRLPACSHPPTMPRTPPPPHTHNHHHPHANTNTSTQLPRAAEPRNRRCASPQLLQSLISSRPFLPLRRWLLWGVLGRTVESCCRCSVLSCLFSHAPDTWLTYQEALAGSPCMLQGTATYRLPHHPRYKDSFANPLYKPIWFKAFGISRYTRLVRGARPPSTDPPAPPHSAKPQLCPASCPPPPSTCCPQRQRLASLASSRPDCPPLAGL